LVQYAEYNVRQKGLTAALPYRGAKLEDIKS